MLWTHTLEGSKDADVVLKVVRNISSLYDFFQVSFFVSLTRMSVYIDHLAKIDTQSNTEEVAALFKVNFPKHE